MHFCLRLAIRRNIDARALRCNTAYKKHSMADGREYRPDQPIWSYNADNDVYTVNQPRAMRVAEIMADFRNLQTYIAAIRANPSADEYNEDGYVVLRQCVAAALALLQQPFNTSNGSRGDPEHDKAQLRRYCSANDVPSMTS